MRENCGRIPDMEKQKILKLLESETDRIWGIASESWPILVRKNPPKIELNSRFYRTAGCNHQYENRIELGLKFFKHYANSMVKVILPHEIAHQIEYHVFPQYEGKLHHGADWAHVMRVLGQEPKAYHSMHIDRNGNLC